MGQIETAVAAIIAAINRVNKTMQETTGYRDEHIILLGGVAPQIVGVGGALAGLPIETELIGTIAASCTTTGAMAGLIKSIAGALSAAGTTAAELKTITELIGSLSSAPTVAGVFSDATILLKAVTAALADIDGSNLEVITTLVGTSAGTTSGVAAKLWT